MNIRDHIFIARPDHWGKNIFVLPGAFCALFLSGAPMSIDFALRLAAAVAAACILASANYTINEWLDSSFDRFHPTKKDRPGAQGHLRADAVIAQYVVLAAAGVLASGLVSPLCRWVAVFFLAMAICYNVPPIRTKDRAFLDVISESINNPIRFIIGWLACTGAIMPPSSILLAYWAGGAFLMAAKRYAEYRFIGDPERASLYRRSFSTYTEKSLLLFSFFCALLSSFFAAIFLFKYRIEFIVLFPFLAILFTWYLSMSMEPGSAAISPEKLFFKKTFFSYCIFLCVLTGFLAAVDISVLYILTDTFAIGRGGM